MMGNQNFHNTVDDYIRSRISAPTQSFSVLPKPNQTTSVAIGAGELIFDENDIDIKSMSLKAAKELFKRPREGRTYSAHVERIEERLKDLSVSESPPEDSTDEALEIADAATLLRLLGKSNTEIELAGQKAKRGAHLMQLATIILEKGEELFNMSKLTIMRKYDPAGLLQHPDETQYI